MLTVETIGRIRREFFVKGKTMAPFSYCGPGIKSSW